MPNWPLIAGGTAAAGLMLFGLKKAFGDVPPYTPESLLDRMCAMDLSFSDECADTEAGRAAERERVTENIARTACNSTVYLTAGDLSVIPAASPACMRCERKLPSSAGPYSFTTANARVAVTIQRLFLRLTRHMDDSPYLPPDWTMRLHRIVREQFVPAGAWPHQSAARRDQLAGLVGAMCPATLEAFALDWLVLTADWFFRGRPGSITRKPRQRGNEPAGYALGAGPDEYLNPVDPAWKATYTGKSLVQIPAADRQIQFGHYDATGRAIETTEAESVWGYIPVGDYVAYLTVGAFGRDPRSAFFTPVDFAATWDNRNLRKEDDVTPWSGEGPRPESSGGFSCSQASDPNAWLMLGRDAASGQYLWIRAKDHPVCGGTGQPTTETATRVPPQGGVEARPPGAAGPRLLRGRLGFENPPGAAGSTLPPRLLGKLGFG